MGNYASLPAFCLLFALFAPDALARAETSNPAGEWLVKDKTAHIRITACGAKLWGAISWVNSPGTDSNNPDPSRRNRPILGLPILLGMQEEAPGIWKGNIYNADNGKTYRGDIRLVSNDILHVRGCIIGGLLCGGEDWTRLASETGSKESNGVCRQVNEGSK